MLEFAVQCEITLDAPLLKPKLVANSALGNDSSLTLLWLLEQLQTNQ